MVMVTIPQEEYLKLHDDSDFLRCLRNNGVDNWEWYGEALREHYGEEEDE